MQIALISDIHGNAIALEAVLNELEAYPADRIICLGDAIQGGSEPARVLKLLRELDCPVIMGNSDSFLLTDESAEPVPESAHEVRQWTVDQIGDEGIAYIRSFVPTLAIDIGGEQLLCFHGSPKSFDEVLLPDTPDASFEEALSGHSATIYAGGHTHYQWSKRLGDRTYFNPGSVGVAYNRLLPRESFYLYPLAEYAVLKTSEQTTSIEFRHLVLDPGELSAAARNSGAPHSETQAKRFDRPRGG